ncbi:MAG: peptidoglycan DD-metalloendopeptidase family protein, partial [bacterium]|nr:peptidoglycan DD-metalloendopeptidase family protein [bacterium]
PEGDSLSYSTYLGGGDDDCGYAIAVDSTGAAYITGFTESTDFPTKNPYQTDRQGGCDVFVVKITPDGPPPDLSFTDLTPSEISTSTAPYDAELLASGSNFKNVNKITFEWSGATSGSATWNKGDASWNERVKVTSDNYMTLRPRVVETDPTWSGTVNWTVTLKDTTNATASKSFTVTYLPRDVTLLHPNGWYWPTGTSNTGGYLGWLELGTGPYKGKYHLGQDFKSNTSAPVYALAEGKILYSRTDVGGYGPGGTKGGALVALFKTSTGREFKALYGHINNPLSEGSAITAGQIIGYINEYNPPHLHFGIHPGSDLPSDGNIWRGYTDNLSNTYGWVDPIEFLNNNFPPSEQPQFKAPWSGIAQITQGNHGATSHYDHGVWDNTYAIDVALPVGTDVLAPADGIISWSDPDPGGAGGIGLAIDCIGPTGKTFTMVFLHLSEIIKEVGSSVKQGEVIAKSGATGTWKGNVVGPHLHFHLWSGKGARDSHTIPIERLVMKQVGVDSDFREYDARKRELDDSKVAGKYFESNNSPLTCTIKLQKEGIEIDEIDVGESFDIYVGDSTGDISKVRFSSDESQDGIPQGSWVEYDWNISSGDWNATTKIMRWRFATPGIKEVWAEVEDDIGQVDKHSTNIYIHPGYAIIVAGEGKWWIPGDKHSFDHCANNVYRALRNLGFDDEHIFYLNSKSPQDIDKNGDDEVDMPALLSNFEKAINEIKNRIGNNPIPFILYLVGHGVDVYEGSFIFDENDRIEGYLWVNRLQELLSKFSNETKMFIMINSCYSGRFITSNKGISASNRIIITSTHDNQKIYAFTWVRFSDRIWGNLNKGMNVKDAFIEGFVIPEDICYSWLDDNGDKVGHPPNCLQNDGELAGRTKIGIPGTEDLELNCWSLFRLGSPGEPRVYDSQNLVTGLVDGEVKVEIPNSAYQDDSIAIFSPSDSYRYEVVGTGSGNYGLEIASIKGEEATIFTATNIPTSPNAVHQYTIDWDVLSQGEKGVTVKIDSDGDGEFEQTINTGNEFTYGPISGKVTDTDNRPLKDVKVEVIKGEVIEKFALTDANGNYSISDLSGTYSVRASKEGWATQTKDNITPGTEVNFTLVFNLRYQVLANRDNDISLPDGTRIFIPKDALSCDTFLVISFPDSVPSPPGGLKATGVYRKFSLENGKTQFLNNKFATISIPYKDENNDGLVDGTEIKEDTLKVFFLNGRAWVRDFDTKVYPINNLCKVNTTHLTTFGIFSMIAQNLEDVVVYPNPFKPSKGHTEIRFERLTENVTIRIYNIAGELVRMEENIITGFFDWDAKNDYGKNVASGVYIYVIIDNEGRIKKGKIAIIR